MRITSAVYSYRWYNYEALPGYDASCTLATMGLTVEKSHEWDDLANLGEED